MTGGTIASKTIWLLGPCGSHLLSSMVCRKASIASTFWPKAVQKLLITSSSLLEYVPSAKATITAVLKKSSPLAVSCPNAAASSSAVIGSKFPSKDTGCSSSSVRFAIIFCSYSSKLPSAQAIVSNPRSQAVISSLVQEDLTSLISLSIWIYQSIWSFTAGAIFASKKLLLLVCSIDDIFVEGWCLKIAPNVCSGRVKSILVSQEHR